MKQGKQSGSAPSETQSPGSGETGQVISVKTNGDPSPKFKVGDYIKRINRKRSSISFKFPFFIGETVVVEGMYLDNGGSSEMKEWVYCCKNKYGIYWNLCECESSLSAITEFNNHISEYTPAFVLDNLYLCGILKNRPSGGYFDPRYKNLLKYYHSVLYNRRMERRPEELRYLLNEKETFFTKVKKLLS